MKNIIPILLLILLSLSIPAGQAGATAILGLSNGAIEVVVLDQSELDSNSIEGMITYNGSVGSWTANVTTGITKPVLGSNTAPMMDLSGVHVTSAAMGWLAVAFTESGFTYSGDLTTLLEGTTTGTASFYTAVGDAAFNIDSLLVNDPLRVGAFSGTWTYAVDLSPGDWLTIGASIGHSGSGTTSFDVLDPPGSVPVPEPGTMMLLGSGLVGLAAWGRKRMKR